MDEKKLKALDKVRAEIEKIDEGNDSRTCSVHAFACDGKTGAVKREKYRYGHVRV